MNQPRRRFRMPIDEITPVTGRGTLLRGTAREGELATGDRIEILAAGKPTHHTVVLAIESAGKVVPHARARQAVGVLVRAVDPSTVRRGHVLLGP